MANEKGVLRSVLVPALLAVVGVALIAWLTSGGDSEPPVPSEPVSAVAAEPAPAEEPEPEPEPPPEPAANAPALDPSQLAPVAALGAAEQPTDEGGGVSKEERMRHGRLMIPAALLAAIEQDTVEHARSMRDQLQAKRSEGYLTDTDFEALDLVIDCMEHVSDAREEARDFLQFGSPTILGEALKRACVEKR